MRVGLTLLFVSFGHVGCRETGGGQSGDEGNGHGEPPTAVGMGHIITPVCVHQASYGPEGPYFVSQCDSTDERYFTGELRWNGEETPSGPYRCDCPTNSRYEVPTADNCEDALVLACGVDLQEPQPCFDEHAACWPVFGAPGSWRCRCSADGPLATVVHDDCHGALLLTSCPLACSSDAGQCATSPGDGG
jgi:hypothetical protein